MFTQLIINTPQKKLLLKIILQKLFYMCESRTTNERIDGDERLVQCQQIAFIDDVVANQGN